MIVAHDITERKRAEEALQQSTNRLRRQQQTLLELTKQRTILQDDMRTMVRITLENVARTLDLQRISIWLYRRNRTRITCLDLYEVNSHQHTCGAELWRDDILSRGDVAGMRSLDDIVNNDALENLLQTWLQQNHDREIGDGCEDLPLVPGYSLPHGKCTSSVMASRLDIPLRFAGEKVGVVIYERHDVHNPYAIEEQNFAHSIADILSLSLEQWERKRTEQELQRSQERFKELVRREEMLNRRLTSQIRDSLDLDSTLSTAVHEICDLLSIDLCNFFWHSPESTSEEMPVFNLVHQAIGPRLSPSLVAYTKGYPLNDMPQLGQRLIQQEIITTSEVRQDRSLAAATRSVLMTFGFTAQLLLPIQTRSGNELRQQSLRPLIVAAHCNGPRQWNKEEIELVESVADQLAIAIDQAELFESTQRSAASAYAQALQLENALADLQKTQTQLIQTEKMSSLGQLVAGVAHEINNPVNFIHGNLNHAGRSIQDLVDVIKLYQKHYPEPHSEIEKYLEEMDFAFLGQDLPKLINSMKIGAERIRQIVLSLRNFSRVDQEGKKPCNVHEGIDNTLLILQNRLKPYGDYTGIEVKRNYGDLPLVYAYAGQLNQVFMNILSNAVDAIEEQLQQGKNNRSAEPATITISTYTYPEQNLVLIEIGDNGPGVPSEIHSRLFDPFFTTKPVGRGTGLGLSISYQIVVEKHHGKLECISEHGHGTIFRIELPVGEPIAASA